MKKIIKVQINYINNLLDCLHLFNADNADVLNKIKFIKTRFNYLEVEDLSFYLILKDIIKNSLLNLLNIGNILDILDPEDFYILENILEVTNNILTDIEESSF